MQNTLVNLTVSDTSTEPESPLYLTDTSKPAPLSSIELARLAMEAASDKKAQNIMALNVGPYLVLVDYFVIATGSTDRQCAAIVDAVEDKLAKEGRRKSHTREGDNRGTWILLDYGDLVVHVFQPQARDEYRLEKLWGQADRIRMNADGEIGELEVSPIADAELIENADVADGAYVEGES